ncbi:MAG: type II secretion system F family protein [Nitrososphaerota archaeon]
MLGLSSRKELRECKVAFPYLMLFLNLSISSKQGLGGIVKILSRGEGPLAPFSQVFYKIYSMINRWGYKQHHACSIAAKMVKEPSLKGLMTRLAQALGVGTNIYDFFKVEYSKFVISSQREHQNLIDRLKSLSEAYSAILTAGTVISVSILVTSTLMGVGSPSTILALVFGGILVASLALSFLMYTSSIRPRIITDLPMKPRRLHSLEVWSKYTCSISLSVGPATFILLAGFDFLPRSEVNVNSLSLGISGVLPFIVGMLGQKEVKKVKSLEDQFPIFIKVLGEASSASGTLQQGLQLTSINEYGPLNPLIQRLGTRLKLGVKNEVAWIHFAGETGSRLISDLIYVLLLAVRLGSKLGETCYSLFEAANEEMVRRIKRDQVASFLKGLVYPIQGTLVAVLTLTSVLMELLNRFAAYSATGVVSYVDPKIIEAFSFAVIFCLAVMSALSIYFVGCGTVFVFLSNLGNLLLLSALASFFLDKFAFGMLEGFAQLGSKLMGGVP